MGIDRLLCVIYSLKYVSLYKADLIILLFCKNYMVIYNILLFLGTKPSFEVDCETFQFEKKIDS